MKARCLQSVLHLLVAVVIAWIHVLTNGATHQEVVLMGCLKGTTRLRWVLWLACRCGEVLAKPVTKWKKCRVAGG